MKKAKYHTGKDANVSMHHLKDYGNHQIHHMLIFVWFLFLALKHLMQMMKRNSNAIITIIQKRVIY